MELISLLIGAFIGFIGAFTGIFLKEFIPRIRMYIQFIRFARRSMVEMKSIMDNIKVDDEKDKKDE